MRRPLSIACLSIACCCTNGVLLEVAQVVAWGRMFAGYVESMPVGEAICQTFTPGRTCPMCRAVQKARAANRGQVPAPMAAAGRLVLFCQQSELLVPPTCSCRATETDPASFLERHDPVPVPPPKGFVPLIV